MRFHRSRNTRRLLKARKTQRSPLWRAAGGRLTGTQVSDSTPSDKLCALALCDDIRRGKYRGLLAALTRDSPMWISCEGISCEGMSRDGTHHPAAEERQNEPIGRLQRAVSIELD